jgi:hypothetical protein
MRTTCFGVLAGALIAGSSLHAEMTAVGTAGAQELRIPVGARMTALSGSNVSNLVGVEAMFWNPGGLANMEGSQASFGNCQYWADMNMTQFSAGHNFGEKGAIGIAARVFNVGDLLVTTEDMPAGTGETIQPKFSIVTMGWAKQMTDRVNLGVNLNLLSEKIKDMHAKGYSLDFGVQVSTPMDGLDFGVVLKNFGPDMSYAGYGGEQRVVYETDETGAAHRVARPIYQPFELPSSFQFGVAYAALEDPANQLSFFGTYQSNHHSTDEYRLGTEYSFHNQLFARAGYVVAADVAEKQDYLYTWSAGLGFMLDLGENNMFIDWSYNPNEHFDASQWYTIRFDF